MPLDHITICLCTCRRAGRLAGLLSDLARQESGGAFTYSLSVVDNDPAASASEVIAAFARKGTVPVQASWEPEPNIARSRNRSLEGASGNIVAFIDDDETPAPDWLRRLHTALLRDGDPWPATARQWCTRWREELMTPGPGSPLAPMEASP